MNPFIWNWTEVFDKAARFFLRCTLAVVFVVFKCKEELDGNVPHFGWIEPGCDLLVVELSILAPMHIINRLSGCASRNSTV